MSNAFFDSNIVIYLTSADTAKATKARSLLEAGGTVSVQVLNETVSVLRRKNQLDWPEVLAVLAAVQDACEVAPLTIQTQEMALAIAQRFGLHIYDASILAAAKLAGCTTVWSEDMQDGQLIEGVTIRTPF